jgi:hypothetical protein
MQFYRRNLPPMQRDDTPHFITFCTKLRRTLPDWARATLCWDVASTITKGDTALKWQS